MTAEPTITVEIAFDANPFSTSPTWTDISEYVESFSMNYGRPNEIGSVEAGTCDLVLDNTDGRFTPGRSASPYYPNLLPRRPVRITADADLGGGSATYPVFYGYVDRWPASASAGSVEVTVSCTDGLKLISKQKLTQPYVYDLLNTYGAIECFSLSAGEGATEFAGIVDPLNDRAVITTTNSSLPKSRTGDTGYNTAEDTLLPSGNGGTSLFLHDPGYRDSDNVVFGYMLDCGEFDISNLIANSPFGWSISLFHNPDAMIYSASGNDYLDGTVFELRDPNKQPVISVHYHQQKDDLSDSSGYRVYYGIADDTYQLTYPTALDVNYPAPNLEAGVGSVNQIVFSWDPSDSDYGGIPTFKIGVNGTHTGIDVSAVDSRWYRNGPFHLYVGAQPYNQYFNGAHTAHYQYVTVHDRALSNAEMVSVYESAKGYPDQLVPDRLDYLLDQIGWPAAWRDYSANDPGTKILFIPWEDTPDTITELRAPVLDAQGDLFIDPRGYLVYQSRFDRANPVVEWILDEDAGTGADAPLDWEMTDDDIQNIVNVDNAYGIKATVKNQASVDYYGQASYNLTTRLTVQDEALQQGYWLVNRFADARLRLDQVILNPSAQAGGLLWNCVLNVRPSDVIGLRNLPAEAPASSLDYFVESIRHDVARDGDRLVWMTTLQVSDTGGRGAWVLGDSTYGVLGSTTILHY